VTDPCTIMSFELSLYLQQQGEKKNSHFFPGSFRALHCMLG